MKVRVAIFFDASDPTSCLLPKLFSLFTSQITSEKAFVFYENKNEGNNRKSLNKVSGMVTFEHFADVITFHTGKLLERIYWYF